MTLILEFPIPGPFNLRAITRSGAQMALRCFQVVHTFGNSCFNFSDNLYALEYAYVLANLCEQSELDTERIKKVLMEQCAGDKLTEKKTA
ncbi:hypothetical protein niasHT_010565 [Heterodera trifolii]|uniref:Legumain prodomain domain-containing protein n=1 Tax=Heterodera trifolii TaxID=157864 RepID=A0ABD2L2H7_9BILA